MQVFQSVPTHDDMMALSHQVKQAKQGQARLLIMVIFLVGVLAAAVVALFMVFSNTSTQLAEADQKLTAQAAELKKLETEVANRDQVIASQQGTIASYAGFQSIVQLQQQSKALEKDIADLLAQPSRANAPRRLKELPADVEWLDDVITRLTERRDALAELKSDVEAWPPIPAAVRPD
jgi:Tfp pilus assembly protein PilV